MPTKKKGVKVRDLKPSKDAKGGRGKPHLDGGVPRKHQYGGTRQRN